jgi:hypothetical protein
MATENETIIAIKKYLFRNRKGSVFENQQGPSRRPTSAPFLSGDTYRALANVLLDETADCDPVSIVDGSIVFVGARRLHEFGELV